MEFSNAAGPVLVAAIFSFVLYRRIRRSVGRQRISSRMFIRIAILGIVGLLILALPSNARAVQLGALAAGVALGLYGLSRTRFVREGADTFYTPAPYVGMFVVALLVGRLIYRMTTFRPGRSTFLRDGPSPEFSITLTMLLAIIGYYLCYYIGVLRHGRTKLAIEEDAG